MTDKTDVAEAGSIDNPLGLPEEELASRWTKILEVGTPRSEEFIADASKKLLPSLALAEKLGLHANGLVMAMKMLQKQEDSKDKALIVVDRLRAVLTLKENMDEYVTNSCENILDKLEKM